MKDLPTHLAEVGAPDGKVGLVADARRDVSTPVEKARLFVLHDRYRTTVLTTSGRSRAAADMLMMS